MKYIANKYLINSDKLRGINKLLNINNQQFIKNISNHRCPSLAEKKFKGFDKFNSRSRLIALANNESFICQQLSEQSFKLQKGTQAFRVSIGQNLYCTCHLEHQHCVHTLYILMKFFGVDKNSDILRQDSYDQKTLLEIDKRKCYSIIFPVKNKWRFNEKQQQSDLNTIKTTRQHDINYDVCCAICQQDLKLKPTYFCKEQCGTNFHAECLRKWTIGKFKITCPICRQLWDSSVVNELKQISELIIHNEMCTQCKIEQIKGTLYKCPTCADTYMCELCYKNQNFHRLNHQVYLKRVNAFDPWVLTTQKTQLIYKQLPNLNDQTQSQQLPKIMSQTGYCFKTQQGQCSYCDNIASKQLRCGHIVDLNCISKLVGNEFKCPLDGCEIFNVESKMLQSCTSPIHQSKLFLKQKLYNQ